MMMIVLPACGALAALPIRVFRSMSQDGFLSIDTQEKAEAVAGISDELVCRNIDEYRLNKNSEEIKNNQYQEIEFRKSGITLAKETKQVEFDVRNQLIRKDRDGDMKMIDFNNWGH